MGEAGFPEGLPFGPVPQVPVKASPFLPDGQEHPGVGHRRPDLQPVPDNGRILPECFYFFFCITGNDFRIEAVKGLPEPVPFVKHTFPGKAGLEGFQKQHFEQLPVLMDRSAPFLIMVPDVPGIVGVGPEAPLFSVRPLGHNFHLLHQKSCLSRQLFLLRPLTIDS